MPIRFTPQGRRIPTTEEREQIKAAIDKHARKRTKTQNKILGGKRSTEHSDVADTAEWLMNMSALAW
jgi:hypothetical protein